MQNFPLISALCIVYNPEHTRENDKERAATQNSAVAQASETAPGETSAARFTVEI